MLHRDACGKLTRMEIHHLLGLMTLGQLLLLIVVLVCKPPVTRLQAKAIALLVSVVGYVVASNAALQALVGPAYPLFLFLAMLPPYLLWLFAIDVFEVSYLPRFLPAGRGGLILLVPALTFASMWTPLSASGLIIHHIASILLLAHTLVTVWLERGDDLLNPRRRFRMWFVGMIAIQAAAILLVELIYAERSIPTELEVLNMAAIGVLVLVLAVPLLRLDTEVLWLDVKQNPGITPGAAAPGPAQPEPTTHQALIQSLQLAMDTGAYTTSGLTIKQLADQLQTTEHVLRAAINQHLGYRNFNAFLNQYRIDAAKVRLQDPGLAKTPILTIALDLGYQSIGPFNRAFKASTGVTPSEFRKNSTANLAESEKT